MPLNLHIGTVGIGHLFLPHSNWGLGPEGPVEELDVGSHSLLPLQLSPIDPYVSPPDPLGNTNLLALFLSLHRLATTAISIV